MENENQVTPPNGEAVVSPNDTQVKQDEQIDWEAKARKAEELANNYKIRAEKAEKAAKGTPTQEVPVAKSDLSPMDIYALMDAKVPQEDISEVTVLAKAYGVPVSEALKLDSVKATLAYKAETRKTAQATAVGASRRSSTKVSDEVILENASKGRLPQSDDEIEALVAARDKARKKK